MSHNDVPCITCLLKFPESASAHSVVLGNNISRFTSSLEILWIFGNKAVLGLINKSEGISWLTWMF
jgi:hypothetical protein